MIKFAVGVVVGITIATIGVGGLVKIVDTGVAKVQSTAKDAARGE